MNAQTENANAPTMDKIIGLKTEVKRQVGLHKYTASKLSGTERSLRMAWRLVSKFSTTKGEVENLIWDHVLTYPIYQNIESEKVGIYSTIGDYTNESGETFKAHFTTNGKFLHRVRKNGDKPESYKGWFQIEPELFEIDFEKLESNAWIKDLSELFIPYTLVPEEDRRDVWKPVEDESVDESDDDIPVAQLIANKKKTMSEPVKEPEPEPEPEPVIDLSDYPHLVLKNELDDDNEPMTVISGFKSVDEFCDVITVVEAPKPKRKYVRKAKPVVEAPSQPETTDDKIRDMLCSNITAILGQPKPKRKYVPKQK